MERQNESGVLPSTMRNLSARQLELARLVAQGYTNTEIAMRLGLPRQTVKNHVQAAYRKLGVHNRVRLGLSIGNSALQVATPANTAMLGNSGGNKSL